MPKVAKSVIFSDLLGMDEYLTRLDFLIILTFEGFGEGFVGRFEVREGKGKG